ncbi:unnamed protein product [Dimorphilus gyrociliatus]|uniref:Acyl-ACP thioesterase-like C-terminal domain-containing protein n=1 Tax=Dimorphilus gyrociliatus TaxID=2664684 RepID=A0A7I8VDY7_9ANNE|nr:unnamed protein product [Dimorphilus gyrociliatus]
MNLIEDESILEVYLKKKYDVIDPVTIRVKNVEMKMELLRKYSSFPLTLGTFLGDVFQTDVPDGFTNALRWNSGKTLLFIAQCEILFLPAFYTMLKSKKSFENFGGYFLTHNIKSSSAWEKYIIKTLDGQDIVYFTSRSVMVDSKKRKPITDFFDRDFSREKIYTRWSHSLPDRIVKLINLGKPDGITEHTIDDNDIDANNHTNFMVYIHLTERCIKKLSPERNQVKKANISYKGECLLGDVLIANCWKINEFYFYFEIVVKDRLVTLGNIEYFNNESSYPSKL